MCIFSHEHGDSKESKLLIAILKELKEIHMALIDDLTTAVAANTDAVKAVVAEIQVLESQGTVDPVALQAAVDQLNTNNAALNAAAVPPATNPAPVFSPVLSPALSSASAYGKVAR